MQQEETLGSKDDRIDSPSGKQSPNKEEDKATQSAETGRDNEATGCVNGVQVAETENTDSQSSNNEARPQLSPSGATEPQLSGNSQLNQPLHFELGPEVSNNFTIGNYWGISADDTNGMQNFQSFNTSTMQNYGLNNNNSFHQPLPFGSIGQPSFVAAGNNQYPSPPGMPNMSMMNNMGQVNNHMGGFSYQNTQNQNQRRAITAQHNYGAVNNKSLNPRLPWSNQHSPWPNTSQQSTMSPWTMALQQQRAKGGMNGVQMAKKGQSSPSVNMNHNPAINNFLVQQKMKRASSAPNQALNSNGPKSYSVAIGSDRSADPSALSYTVCPL